MYWETQFPTCRIAPDSEETFKESKYSSVVAVAFLGSLSICSSRGASAAPGPDRCSLLTQT